MSDTLNLFARFSAWWLGPKVFRVMQLWGTLRNGLRPDRLRKRHKPARRRRHAPEFWRASAIFFVPLDQQLDGVPVVQGPKPLTVVHDRGPLGATLWLAGRHGLAPECEPGVGRADDTLDQVRERLEGVRLFFEVAVQVVCCSDGRQRVAKAALGDVAVDPGPRQQGSGCSAHVVQAPAAHAGYGVEPPLRV